MIADLLKANIHLPDMQIQLLNKNKFMNIVSNVQTL